MRPIHELLDSPKPIKWLFYGDSITHGAYHTMGWRDYTELFSERIRYELGRLNDIVINTAYSGNTTRHLLESFEWRVEQFQPHVVFVMIGTNDCCIDTDGLRVPIDEFKKNLEGLVQRIRAMNGAVPILQTTSPLLKGGAPTREENFPKYMEMIRQVAQETDSPIIDHTDYWQQNDKMKSNVSTYWMSDAFHPNEMGHRVFAELIFKEFKIYSPDSTTCRFFHA